MQNYPLSVCLISSIILNPIRSDHLKQGSLESGRPY